MGWGHTYAEKHAHSSILPIPRSVNKHFWKQEHFPKYSLVCKYFSRKASVISLSSSLFLGNSLVETLTVPFPLEITTSWESWGETQERRREFSRYAPFFLHALLEQLLRKQMMSLWGEPALIALTIYSPSWCNGVTTMPFWCCGIVSLGLPGDTLQTLLCRLIGIFFLLLLVLASRSIDREFIQRRGAFPRCSSSSENHRFLREFLCLWFGMTDVYVWCRIKQKIYLTFIQPAL